MKIVSINHTGIIVENLDYTVRFFTDLLGFKLIDRGTRGVENQSKVSGLENAKAEIAYVEGGGHSLELICYAGSTGTSVYHPMPYDVGHWHLSVVVTDLNKAVKETIEYGLKVVAQEITVDNGPNKGNRIIYMSLPDGVIIEFIQPGNQKNTS